MNINLMLKTLVSLSALVIMSHAQDIRLPPGFIVSPAPGVQIFKPAPPSSVSLDYLITISCQAAGFPAPTYTWLLDGSILDTSGNNYNRYPNVGTIDIIWPTVANQGYYQCRASNAYGTTISSIPFYQMASLGEYLTSKRINITATLNGYLTLPCTAPPSVPAANIFWTNNVTNITQIQVQVSTRVQIDFSGNLWFANVLSSTELPNYAYRCNVNNYITSTQASGPYTNIQIGSSISSAAPAKAFSSPSQVLGLETQSIALRCFFSGSPTPTYSWTYNGSAILPNGWSPIMTDVSTAALRASDAGIYVCQGINTQGTSSVTIQLTVDAVPVFQTSQQPYNLNVNVTQGNSVTITCNAYAKPSATVQWFKNGNAFSQTNLPPKFTMSADLLSITISNLCKNCSDGTSDLMSIQCNASNYHGYAFAQGYVNVLFPTTVTSSSTTTIWTSNQNVQFQCLATSDQSTPITRQWLFNGNAITQSQTIYVDSYGTLNIIMANDTDGGASRIGDYTCVVFNNYSTASVVYYLTGNVSTASAQYWWIGLLVALIIVLLLLLIVCCFFGVHLREGKSYPVDEHERKNGGDPVQELKKTGFKNYQPQTPGVTQNAAVSVDAAPNYDNAFPPQRNSYPVYDSSGLVLSGAYPDDQMWEPYDGYTAVSYPNVTSEV